MEATDYRVLRINTDRYESSFAIVYDDDITIDGHLIDTDTGTGEALRHADIGDYSFGQDDFDNDLRAAIRKHFTLDNDLEGLSFNDDNDEIEFAIDSATYEQDEYLEDFVDEHEDELMEFVKKWIEENESLITATYINYWDGSNNNSIVIRTELDDDNCVESEYELLDEDDEEAIKIIDEFINEPECNEVEGVGTREWDTEHYHYMTSTWERDSWFVALVNER